MADKDMSDANWSKVLDDRTMPSKAVMTSEEHQRSVPMYRVKNICGFSYPVSYEQYQFSLRLRLPIPNLVQLLVAKLKSPLFEKIRHVLGSPEEVGMRDICPFSSTLEHLLQKLETPLTNVISLPHLFDRCVELGGRDMISFIFDGLPKILDKIAYSDELSKLLKREARDTALKFIIFVYDKSFELGSNIEALESLAEADGDESKVRRKWYPQSNSLLAKPERESFDSLPEHLKRCFLYTCLFLREGKFDKDTLVQLWMAVGFIYQTPYHSKSSLIGMVEDMEDVGRDYFNELCQRNLLQESWVHEKFYDLVQQEYSQGQFASLGYNGEARDISIMTLHASLFNKSEIIDKITFEALDKAKILRTLVLFNGHPSCTIVKEDLHYLFTKLRFLRVLDLRKIVLVDLPDSIGTMEHLRYLDLSATSIKVLPQTLVTLERLQTLKLSHNRELVSLPNDIHKLRRLRFFDLSYTGIRVLPTTFGELWDLRYLDLSYTPIKSLPESVVMLRSLTTLRLCHCSSLSGSFHYMTMWKNIQCLDLSYTGIEMLPELVSHLINLQSLTVEGCSRLAGLPSDMDKLSKGIKLLPYMPFIRENELVAKEQEWGRKEKQQKIGHHSPRSLLNLLDSPKFTKMRHILRNPQEMGVGNITLISSPLLRVLRRLELSLCMLIDAEPLSMLMEHQTFRDRAIEMIRQHQPLFKGLWRILDLIASCVSGPTTLIIQRKEALDIINSIYDNSFALNNISLQLETIGTLVRFALSEEMARMSEQMSSMDTKFNEGSTSDVVNTSEVCKSFHNLPEHLKRCVIYTCILFLGDYEFEEDTLIPLWIAIGFIRTGQEELAERGRIYFKELQKLSIFQMSSFVCENNEPTYRVHEDVYKPILQCYTKEYVIRKEGGSCQISPMTLHSVLLLSDKIHSSDSKIFEGFDKAVLLRTLKLQNECGSSIKNIPHILFVKLRFLRVLDLSSTEIKALPISLYELRHLRYLDISNTRIKRLSESLSKLSSLETLKLRGCSDLVGLPKEISKLTNLQHLDLDGVYQLTSMPPSMGQLTNLQKLSIFIVGKEKGFQIEELKCMKKLRGSLCITKMENVTKDQVNEAQLVDKFAICKLEFQWSSSQSKIVAEFNLIEPHLSIEQLKITRYGAESFPDWLSSEKFYKLTVIHLRNCNCTHLPDLGKLPSLKSLYIHEMHSLEDINHELYGAFPKLEVLAIDGMPCLKEWTAIKEDVMRNLLDLTIIDCPKLVTLPEFGKLNSLEHLRITLCPEIQSFPGARLPESLQSLTITECEKLEEQCRKENGCEWCKIAGIPEIWIEYQQISSTETREQPSDIINEMKDPNLAE